MWAWALLALIATLYLGAFVAGCGDNSIPTTTDGVDAGPGPIEGADDCCWLVLDDEVRSCFDDLADAHPLPPGWCRHLDCTLATYRYCY